MRVLRHKGHHLCDRAHAKPMYGGWTIEEPAYHLRGLPHVPARQGALVDKQDI